MASDSLPERSAEKIKNKVANVDDKNELWSKSQRRDHIYRKEE